MSTQNLVQAESIPLFDNKGNQLENYQGIVNKANTKEVFSVVSKRYKIIQHDEVIDSITKSLSVLNLKSEMTVEEVSKARVHVNIIFPDITIDIGEEVPLPMRIEFDNSYDVTTGLRSIVGGFRLICNNGLHIGIITGNYYHRHTKGLEIKQIQKSFEEGIAAFDKEIKQYFLNLKRQKLSTEVVREFLNSCLEDKKLDVGKKYIKKMINVFEIGGDIDIKGEREVDSKWMLYNLISEVVTHDISSIDQRRSVAVLMNKRLDSLQVAA